MNNNSTTWQVGDWVWSRTHGAQGRVVEVTALWDSCCCRVWLPDRDAVVLLPGGDLETGAGQSTGGADRAKERARIRYILTAARLANLLTEDVLLAPVDAAVIPLPHQIRALRRAISQDRIRFLLADEVGLGKTIEAGLIMRELKLRGLVTRTLVVSPRGLVTQSIAEMRTHFGEEFRLFEPSDFDAFRRMSGTDNVWRTYNQVICSLDAVKPVEARRGWSAERLGQYNRERFVDLVGAGWDLVIVDEAHRLGGSSEQVARHQLGRGLAEAAPYVLLLSATPHQGKSDAFHRLVSLLDATAFPDACSMTRERVLPYVIRTEKRQAIDADGRPLFKPRRTQLLSIPWLADHESQRQLYEAVTEYVREGYNRAMKEKKGYLGFLMILMQRLVSSSTQAIATTLERRVEVLRQPDGQLELWPPILAEEWTEMDGQSQLETILRMRLKAMKSERQEVELLLDAARQVQARGPDAKAAALLDAIYRLRQEEGDPDLKVLVFTEFVPTQAMLAEFLGARGFPVACLNGSMDLDERGRVQKRFAGDAQILISTDAGGEGLNLQFCHVVVNYDIPWNPMRLEQRIGRVDRIGQDKVVRAVNFVLEDTVEYRVREVLEAKLAVILEEFGVDKTGDVLDSVEAGDVFDSLYVEALLHPESLDAEVDKAVARVRQEARSARTQTSLFDDPVTLDPVDARRTAGLPLSEWIESMVVDYLDAHGGTLKLRDDGRLDVTWPGADQAVTMALAAGRRDGGGVSADLLSLEHPRIRGIIAGLPRWAEGRPLPTVRIEGLPPDIAGVFSLWQITMASLARQTQRVMPLFMHEDGRCLFPTARFLWDQLSAGAWCIEGEDAGRAVVAALTTSREAAITQGEQVFATLRQKHLNHVLLEKEKGEYGFGRRRQILNGVGLEQVRAHRLRQLDREEDAWRREIERQRQVMPGLNPILLLRIH